MLSQTPEQKQELNKQIIHIMENVVPTHVECVVNQFGDILNSKLGMNEDDILNDIREQVWKALLNFSPKGGASLKTYTKKLIDNRFKLLLSRSNSKKYSSLDYQADPFSNIDTDMLITEETGETLYERRLEQYKILSELPQVNSMILQDLISGYDIQEMMRKNNMSRSDIIASINQIDLLVKEKRKQV